MSYRRKRYQSQSQPDPYSFEAVIAGVIQEIVALFRWLIGLLQPGKGRTPIQRNPPSTGRSSPVGRTPVSFVRPATRSGLRPERKRARWQRIEAMTRQWRQLRADRAATSTSGVIVLDRSVCAPQLPYCRQPCLLSEGERAFEHPLRRAVNGKYRILCKVRLADVIAAPAEQADEKVWFERISAYHVDFVLCDPTTTKPLIVVELDDRSHREDRSRQRDAFKDDALAAAGVPIYRVTCQQAYDPIEIEREIASRLISRDGKGIAHA